MCGDSDRIKINQAVKELVSLQINIPSALGYIGKEMSNAHIIL